MSKLSREDKNKVNSRSQRGNAFFFYYQQNNQGGMNYVGSYGEESKQRGSCGVFQ